MASASKSKDTENKGSEEVAAAENGGTEQISKTATRTSPRKQEVSPPRRPMTRSLSGRPIKRRLREDNALDPANQDQFTSSPPPAKKVKTTRKRATTSTQDDKSTSALRSLPPASGDGSTNEAGASNSAAAESSTPKPMVIAERIGTNRAMRATLPTPVPHLTKKSRGRRVPVRIGTEVVPVDSSSGSSSSKDKRSYVCSVEGCGKCFYRGEHLKRHIRSIHTHEKPFKCTFPECDKHFNRHDNLLQHIKVHTQAVQKQESSSLIDDEQEDEEESSDEASAVKNLLSLSHSSRALKSSPTLLAPQVAQNVGGDTSSSLSSTATLVDTSSDLLGPLRRAYNTMSGSGYSNLSGATSYESSADANLFSSNMAMSSLRSSINVSSLRTSMPDAAVKFKGKPFSFSSSDAIAANGAGAGPNGADRGASDPDLDADAEPDMDVEVLSYPESVAKVNGDSLMSKNIAFPLFQTLHDPSVPQMLLRPISTEQDWKS